MGEQKKSRTEQKKVFYVYQYEDKFTRLPFYVGKGKSDRKSAHLRNARKGDSDTRLQTKIRELGFEKGVEIVVVKGNLTEWGALRYECQLIEEIGRVDLGTGPLLNRTSGGEGISGGIDKYGYRRQGIARKISDMVDNGMLIQDMPYELSEYVRQHGMKVKYVEERIIPHIQEMGNTGCHYKGPKIYLRGWQFSLNRKMIDVNTLTIDTKGFLKVHGDLPFNDGFVAEAPPGYDFGY